MALRAWSDIAESNWTAIILGNGASIAIHDGFSYGSLLNHARARGSISKPLQKVFEHFKSTDFEFVLRALASATAVNSALGIEDTQTVEAYTCVRSALIETVRAVHVSYENALNHLDAVAGYLSRFDTVVSLNYDLLVYWAMLKWNSAQNAHRFKDCFINGVFKHDWPRLRESYGQAQKSTLVFYPHGHLALGTTFGGDEQKLAGADNLMLLEAILEQWNSGAISPLFVSEGTAVQKHTAINRSPYLKTVYEEAFAALGEAIVVYGWSMSEQDQHLLRAVLSRPNLKQLAVSVLPTDDVEAKMGAYENSIRPLALNKKLNLYFFDAHSKGSWIYE